MSAFGRKNGLGGKSSFGVARPMHAPSVPQSAPLAGGTQFPPVTQPAIGPLPGSDRHADAITRLNERMNADHSAGEQAQGFEASVHKIKEQVLPRLLERVDPEAAATLTKDELAEEFRPIIMEVLAELKLTLNRREQFALEKVLVDELLGFGPLEELLGDPDVSDIMVNGPDQTYIEKKGKLQLADSFPRRGASLPDRPAHRQSGRPPGRPDDAAGGRPPAGWQPRQRHRAAALAARHRHLDP